MPVNQDLQGTDASPLVRMAEWRLRIIWASMMMSVLTFVVVTFFVLKTDLRTAPSPPEASAMYVQVLGMMALVLLTAGWLIRSRWALSSERLTTHLEKDLKDGVEDRTTAARASSIRFLQVPCVVSWALFEAIAIFGMVLGVFGVASSLVLGFFALGFGSILLSPPPFARVYREAEQRIM